MIIRNKGIYRDRAEDAPWIGTLVSSISCPYNCSGCINDSLKSINYDTIEADDIIKSILDDPFNEGIILAGLEWSEQPEELCVLISKALDSNLKVILYTHCPNRESLLSKVPSLVHFSNKEVLVKYGMYDETKRVYDYWDHGVRLATSNQYIEEL